MAIAIFLLLLGGYIAFPYYATRALGEALRSGDQERLERSIDYQSLRAALREELRTLTREMVGEDSLMGTLAEVFGGPVLERAVDVCVTPSGLAELIETGELSAAAIKGVSERNAGKDFAIDLEDASWAFFSSPTRFRVELPHAVLQLRLQHGWWQLVAVDPKPAERPRTPDPEDEVADRPEPAASVEPPTFSIVVNARPWATIQIDGIDVGETPVADLVLTEGPHSFRVRFPDDRVIDRIESIDAAHVRFMFEE